MSATCLCVVVGRTIAQAHLAMEPLQKRGEIERWEPVRYPNRGGFVTFLLAYAPALVPGAFVDEEGRTFDRDELEWRAFTVRCRHLPGMLLRIYRSE